MYQYVEQEKHNIFLHDCKATHIGYHKGALVFTFQDGFYVSGENDKNPYNETLRTKKSEVAFHLKFEDKKEDVTIYVFHEKGKRIVRKQYSLKKFMKKINSGEMQLEFLYGYSLQRIENWYSVLFQCYLDKKGKWNAKECQIIIETDHVIYQWNKIDPNKPI